MKVVIYHFPCYDGFGAALAAWLKFGDEARYIGTTYGKPVPDLKEDDDVYILDFSYPRDVLEKMRSRVRSLLILDHHKTAQEALQDFPGAQFDMSRSGAVLAWKHFHPGKSVPLMIQYLQDRDLWTFRLPRSREASAYMRSLPYDFKVWQHLLNDNFFEARISYGVDILNFMKLSVLEMCREARLVTWGEHRVPIVNAASLHSETCEELGSIFPESPFTASFRILASGKVAWSMRSKPSFDCSEVAKQHGGGGHAQASGCTTDLGFLQKLLAIDA